MAIRQTPALEIELCTVTQRGKAGNSFTANGLTYVLYEKTITGAHTSTNITFTTNQIGSNYTLASSSNSAGLSTNLREFIEDGGQTYQGNIIPSNTTLFVFLRESAITYGSTHNEGNDWFMHTYFYRYTGAAQTPQLNYYAGTEVYLARNFTETVLQLYIKP
jgi:hypothetical protein